jgi:hypothetical protein
MNLAIVPIPSGVTNYNGHGISQPSKDWLYNPVLPDQLQHMSGIQYLQKMLPNLIGLAFIIGCIIFFFMLLMGAIQWISSGGDKGKLESARGRITSAIIGIVILLSVFAIMKLVEIFFGINILTLDIGSLIIQ